MKLAIVGSRHYKHLDNMYKFLLGSRKVKDISLIISGGARGVDKYAETFANKFNIPTKIFLPDWDVYGKRAGFLRNKLIVDQCDKLIALWDGRSKGTQHSINLAKKQDKLWAIVCEDYKITIE